LPSTPDRAADGGADFRPLTPATESAAEFTFKAVGAGILFGILFGAANTYLGLRAGLTVSTSIPVSVMTVALFRALRRFTGPQHILEGNMSQAIGSASSSLASGALFTLPALFIWGIDPNLLQMTMLSLIGGVLGTLFMVPLRKLLIVREHGRLPYPEGTACAAVTVVGRCGDISREFLHQRTSDSTNIVIRKQRIAQRQNPCAQRVFAKFSRVPQIA
jgi:putative OPT family oligopeptide transporter